MTLAAGAHVTGGSHLVSRLLQEGLEVVVLDDLSTGTKSNLQVENTHLSIIIVRKKILEQKVVGDICDLDCCRDAMKGVTGVYHLAAMSKVRAERHG
eukprot:scaffold206424_cov45-Prasinocladus_malaysianus.AAC.1